MVTDAAGSIPEKFLEKNLQAEDCIAAGDLPGAAALLVEIIDLDGANYRAYNNLGIVSWVKREWLDAWVMFRKSVELRADYADALSNLFDAALKLKRVPDALPLLDRALAANPSHDAIRIIRDAAVNLGDGIYCCDRALMIGSYSAIIDEAEQELEAGNERRAMELFLKSNDEEGKSAAAYCGLGIISFYQHRAEDAYQLFVESIKLNPTDPDALLNLLEAATACGKAAQARSIFDLCRKKYPHLESIAPKFEMAGVK
jgi:tetratricopeptide (TPR) repeat protein